jgi:hypothetical protein
LKLLSLLDKAKGIFLLYDCEFCVKKDQKHACSAKGFAYFVSTMQMKKMNLYLIVHLQQGIGFRLLLPRILRILRVLQNTITTAL